MPSSAWKKKSARLGEWPFRNAQDLSPPSISRRRSQWSRRPACMLAMFFFQSYGDHRDLHSFPTRRSSDLAVEPGCVGKLADLLLTRPDAGAASPRLQRADG